MACYAAAIDLPVAVEEAFDYLADFSRTSEWDPGVSEGKRPTQGKVLAGSPFQVIVSLLGIRVPLEYRTKEFERASRLVLTGGDASLRSIDDITFVSRPGGTRVAYEAGLELAGIRQLADPFLTLVFARIGRLATRGLRECLAGKSPRKNSSDAGANSARESDLRSRKRAKNVRKFRSAQKQGAVA